MGGTDATGDSWLVEWRELEAVDIRTTARGPFEEDVFMILGARDRAEVIVPQSVLGSVVLERIQQLPGFDNEKFIAAMGSTEDATFTCWRARDSR